METSLQVDHKEETDGKRNLACAVKGLFITHSSRRTAGGASRKEKSQRTRLFLKSWLCTPIAKSSVQFRKMLLFFCVSCEDVNHPTENQELLRFLMKGNFIIYGKLFLFG